MKDRRLRVLIAGVLVALLGAAAVRVDRLRGHVTFLSGPDLAGRRSGQPGALKAAQYIFDQFKQAGFDVRMQEFSDNRRNVVARLGSADQHIILGAHYDGQGSGFPSASDNAAGVAVLIELARDLKAMNLPVSLVAIAFDDEEQGLHGSNFYVDHPIFPLEQVQAAIIFDTMGRHFLDLKKSTLFVLGSEYSRELAQIVNRRGRPDMLVAGVDLIGPRSDFAGFARKKIPFLFFSHATHKDYHGMGDRPELLDYDSIAQDVNLIELMIADVVQSPGRPVFGSTRLPVAGTGNTAAGDPTAATGKAGHTHGLPAGPHGPGAKASDGSVEGNDECRGLGSFGCCDAEHVFISARIHRRARLSKGQQIRHRESSAG